MTFLRPILILAVVLTAVAHAEPTPKAQFDNSWLMNTGGEKTIRAALLDKKAPEIKVTDWVNNDDGMKRYKGKIVVVDLWATWCGPCLAGIPKVNEIQQKYQSQGVEILAVCSSNGSDALADVIEQRKIAYPVAKDVEGATEKAWRLEAYPTYCIIDRDGVLRVWGVWGKYLEQAVQEILKEQPPMDKPEGGSATKEQPPMDKPEGGSATKEQPPTNKPEDGSATKKQPLKNKTEGGSATKAG